MVYNDLFFNRILILLNACHENYKVTSPKLRVICIQKKEFSPGNWIKNIRHRNRNNLDHRIAFLKTKRGNAEKGIVLINVANSKPRGIVATEHLNRII